MDDGLAEKMYEAARAKLDEINGLTSPKWNELRGEEREVWQAAAIVARSEMNTQIEMRTEMLEQANGAWQRENAELQAKLEQHVESVRAATRATMANFASVLNDAINAAPNEARAMLRDLRDGLERVSVVS